MSNQALFAVSAIMIISSVILSITSYHMNNADILWALLMPTAVSALIVYAEDNKK